MKKTRHSKNKSIKNLPFNESQNTVKNSPSKIKLEKLDESNHKELSNTGKN